MWLGWVSQFDPADWRRLYTVAHLMNRNLGGACCAEGIVLALSFLLPVVGWIIFPLWVLLSGFGALLLCLQERRHEQPGAPPGTLVAANQVPG